MCFRSDFPILLRKKIHQSLSLNRSILLWILVNQMCSGMTSERSVRQKFGNLHNYNKLCTDNNFCEIFPNISLRFPNNGGHCPILIGIMKYTIFFAELTFGNVSHKLFSVYVTSLYTVQLQCTRSTTIYSNHEKWWNSIQT